MHELLALFRETARRAVPEANDWISLALSYRALVVACGVLPDEVRVTEGILRRDPGWRAAAREALAFDAGVWARAIADHEAGRQLTAVLSFGNDWGLVSLTYLSWATRQCEWTLIKRRRAERRQGSRP